jgi:hypothetical protein
MLTAQIRGAGKFYIRIIFADVLHGESGTVLPTLPPIMIV